MFLLRPRPYPDESISSWRQRTGFANGFWKFPASSGNRSLADPDRLPSLEEQQWLSDQCGIAPAIISDLSLEARLAQFQKRDIFSPRLRWVLMLGPNSESGPMFCPECLRADERPYFRAHWRYAFLTECPVHQTPLLDRCPSCGRSIWPSTIKSLSRHSPWRNMTECPHCQFDLTKAQIQTKVNGSISCLLWEILSKNEVTHTFTITSSIPSFFDGLWVLSQFLLRRTGQRVLQQIPFEFDEEPRVATSAPEVIEGLGLFRRRRIVASAYWLMDEWPERFLSVVATAGITKATFIPTSSINPSWLTEILDAKLARHNKIITTRDVYQAMKILEEKGEAVSKKAVRRLLEVSESKTIDSVLSRRNHARPDELMALVRKFEQRMAIVSKSRDQRATLIRDYLIFILSVLAQRSIDNICTLSDNDVKKLISDAVIASQTNVEIEMVLKARAKELNSNYSNDVRPKFLKIESPPGRWFIGREGKEFAGHTLRERVAKLMRNDFAEDLWNSCDAFIFSLGEPPLGRRAFRQKFSPINSSDDS